MNVMWTLLKRSRFVAPAPVMAVVAITACSSNPQHELSDGE
jgi:hypothetical protein